MVTESIAILAIVLFIVLLLVVQRLVISRRTAATAQQFQAQTRALLNTIPDGLCLIDRNYRIDPLYSASLETWFNQSALAGASLLDLLGDRVPRDVLPVVQDYIDALFMPHVREKLVATLNPLSAITFYQPVNDNRSHPCYADVIFRRVDRDPGESPRLQVSITDVSRRVVLVSALESSHQRADKQMSMLVKLLHVDPAILQEFLQRTEQGLQNIRNILYRYASQRSHYNDALTAISPIIHVIKGDAALLRLDLFEMKAHQFEDDLALLQKQKALSDGDLLGLAQDLDQFIGDITAVTNIAEHFRYLHQAVASGEELTDRLALADVELLVKKLADSQGKKVQFVMRNRELATRIPEAQAVILRDILVQLVRNAVTHGIEPPLERIRAGKSESGTIQLNIRYQEGKYCQLTLRDDGHGIDTGRLRQTALRSGRLSEHELGSWDDNKILQLLFEPGFSTVEEISTSAGRGVGLEIVQQRLADLPGELQLSTRAGEFCEWRLLVALLSSNPMLSDEPYHVHAIDRR
jgi:signal transduction histidine kinase